MAPRIPEELLPPTTNPSAIAPTLGMSASSVYAAIKTDRFPFPHLRIGGRIVIPTAPIREALGFNDSPAVA